MDSEFIIRNDKKYKRLKLKDIVLLREFYIDAQLHKIKKLKDFDKEAYSNQIASLMERTEELTNAWALYTDEGYKRIMWLSENPEIPFDNYELKKTQDTDDIVIELLGKDPIQFRRDMDEYLETLNKKQDEIEKKNQNIKDQGVQI